MMSLTKDVKAISEHWWEWGSGKENQTSHPAPSHQQYLGLKGNRKAEGKKAFPPADAITV